jgi:pimeloyl-ACP methyl ester carboxylesterase
VNGATRRGRHHPNVQRLARGLARAGFLVAVPDLPGLPLGEITDRTVAATASVARAIAARSDVEDQRLTLVGVSVGTTLALLAAERPLLAGRVRLVAGFAPFTNLRKVIRLATTGLYAEGGRLVPYDADPYVLLAVARSLTAALRGEDGQRLLTALEAVDDEADDPLAVLRTPPPGLGAEARAVVALLTNEDPARFDALYAALSRRLRSGIRRLSPLFGAERLEARVDLASAPDDKYFPPAESRALAARAPDASVTVTRTLSHAVPEPSFRDLADLFRFDGFVVRVLHEAA